jgi:DNA-binding MarR family transcriptional regulator
MRLNFSTFPLDDFIGHIFHVADKELSAALQKAIKAEGYSITPGQLAILTRLWEKDGIHQNLIAEKTSNDKHNITRILNILETNNYIERKSDPKDKRKFNIYLTKEGKSLQETLKPIIDKYLSKTLRGITQKEYDDLLRINKQILANLAVIAKRNI